MSAEKLKRADFKTEESNVARARAAAPGASTLAGENFEQAKVWAVN